MSQLVWGRTCCDKTLCGAVALHIVLYVLFCFTVKAHAMAPAPLAPRAVSPKPSPILSPSDAVLPNFSSKRRRKQIYAVTRVSLAKIAASQSFTKGHCTLSMQLMRRLMRTSTSSVPCGHQKPWSIVSKATGMSPFEVSSKGKFLTPCSTTARTFSFAFRVLLSAFK